MKPDPELIEAYLGRGDRDALEELFRRHLDGVYRSVRRILRNEKDAEDATQGTFLNAIRNLASLKQRELFPHWLHRTAVHVALGMIRARRPQGVLPDFSAEPDVTDERIENVQKALEALPDEVRVPIVLHHLEGLSYEEIGRMTDRPPNSVGTLIHRGLERLRTALGAASVGALVAMLDKAEAAAAPSSVAESVAKAAHSAPISSSPLAPSSAWSTGPIVLVSAVVLVVGAGAVIGVVRRSHPESPRSPVLHRETSVEPSVAIHPAEARTETARPVPAEPSKAQVEPPPESAELVKMMKKNEKAITTGLKMLMVAQADFRANDRNGDGVGNFWTGDVSGLYRIIARDEDGKFWQIKLIEEELAAADMGALPAGPGMAPLPVTKSCHGYWVKALVYTDSVKGCHRSQFGVAAYPEQYGVTGRYTYITGEGNTVFRKDLGGGAIVIWPSTEELKTWEPEEWD